MTLTSPPCPHCGVRHAANAPCRILPAKAPRSAQIIPFRARAATASYNRFTPDPDGPSAA